MKAKAKERYGPSPEKEKPPKNNVSSTFISHG
jgi:hypothetical protein